MISQHQKIIDLYEISLGICVSHITSNWSNSWMWNIPQRSKIIYHHLIYIESDHTFHYNNINNTEIHVKYDNIGKKYRIDIRNRYKLPNFWLFDDMDWLNVELYVKTIIQTEYDSLQKLYSLLDLTNDGYADKQPTKMYQKMNIKQRKLKLNKINNDNKE